MKLNIGGGTERDGWINVDRKEGQEAYPLSYETDSVDEILASHILEHFGRYETADVIAEWVRVLKPGGRIRIAVPDLVATCEAIAKEQPLCGLDPLCVLYGGQTDSNDYHKTGFNADGLAYLMQQAGVVDIGRWSDSDALDCSRYPFSINLEGFKMPSAVEARRGLNVAAVLSSGRISHTTTQATVGAVCQQLHIPLCRVTSAYFEKSLERTFDDLIEQGYEWALCIDGDSVFTAADVARLCIYAKRLPDAGAFIPMQAKRGGKGLLVSVDSEDSASEMGTADLVPAVQGHFGLTLVNLKRVAELPRPWFHHQPDADGRWSDGAVDADIVFWRSLHKSGAPLWCANRIQVGHIEEVIAWTGRDNQTHYQQVTEWAMQGRPLWARG